MEMEIKRVDRRKKGSAKPLKPKELKNPPTSKENVNVGNIEKKEGIQNFEIDVDILPAFLFDPDRRYTKEDLRYNFLALKWVTWIKLSPFGSGVDEHSKNFPRFRMHHKKWWGNGISFGWFLFASVRIFIAILATVHFGMTENPEENLGQMTFMLILTIGGCLILYELSGYFLTAQNLEPFMLSTFKYLDADAGTKTKTEIELQQKKTQPRKFGRHTLRELLIIHLPFLIYSIAGMAPFVVAFDPSFPLLLASLVQPEISFSFLALAALDSVVVLYYCIILHTGFYVFMGMHRIQEEAQLTLKNLTKTKTSSQTTTTKTPIPMPVENENGKEKSLKIQKALKNLGLLHIWTRFFNTSFSYVVYSAKLIALTASILGGFGLIKMIEVENWPYAGIFCLCFLEGIIMYNLCYGRAFEIPEKVEDLKNEIRKQAFKLFKHNSLERKYVEKYLRSIPWLGVNDGVYKMERLTCVNFLCFVTEQVTDLVLTY